MFNVNIDGVNAIFTLLTVTIIGGLIALVKGLSQLKHSLHELTSRPTIIGVVNCKVPVKLRPFKDFSNYRRAIHCTDGIVLLQCRSLSYALRHCDFVCADATQDPKIHKPDDTVFWDSICKG